MKERSLKRNEVSKKQLISDLNRIGVSKGDHLAITLSFKSIGHVQGGPNTFLDTLLEVVGSEGTIMVNTYTHSISLFALQPDFIFDSKLSVPYTGLVPKTLLKRKDMIRSQHPTCSVAAIGNCAEYLTKDHNENSNPFLPYEKLAQINGKYLCIGIGNRLVAIRHEAQRKANLFQVPIFLGVYFKDPSGKKGLFIWKIPPCTENLHSIVPKIEEKIAFRRDKIGEADSIFTNTKELLEVMTEILQKDPQLCLCNDIFCFKCRELERRLNLYSRIESPSFFQKNVLIRTVLFGINKLVLRQFRYAIVFDDIKKTKTIKKSPLDISIPVLLKIASRLLRRKQNVQLKSL